MGMGPLETERLVLRRCWRRWLTIVELFVRRRRARLQIDEQAYGALRKELIAACRSLADPTEGPTRTFYQGLEDLVHPWLTPSVLEKADREILSDLLRRCRRADQDLRNRNRPRASLSWAVSAVALALLGAAPPLLAWAIGRGGWRALDRAQGWSASVWFAIQRSGEAQRLFVATIVVIAFSLFMVSRSARS